MAENDEKVMQTILVVDDKANIRRLVQEYLSEEGFRVVTADNGRNALYVARAEGPDLILLDIMMPEMGGYDFIRTYRQESSIPIICLTAKVEETDKVVGLELGADDYMTKPFGMRELVARIRAVLRRVGPDATQEEIIRAADIVINRSKRTVTVADQDIALTPSEFELLAALARTRGRVFTRMELLDHLPGDAFEGTERSVDVHIRNLRKKIESDAKEPRYIETVHRVGYRFRE